ncbi:MAG: hypothetical protein Q9M97_07390 [Candidatus Gracilibacteria bacterium]|nr:hypothetical protein [Candidatus Gracilibacteria bacterium]
MTYLQQCENEFEDKLELEQNFKKFSFEETLSGEKEMIGFSVSGHALDGLQKYCERRSNKVQKLRMNFDELLELDKKENPKPPLAPPLKGGGNDSNTPLLNKEGEEVVKKKTERKETPIQAVGVISDIRSIITKKGKKMMFLKCEGFDYDFEVVLFPRDVEKFADKVDVDRFIIVNGNLEINFEYKRKSIQARDIKTASITQVREQAKDLGMMNDLKRSVGLFQAQTSPQPSPLEVEGVEKKCDLSDECRDTLNVSLQKDISEYIINIPVSAKKEDLLILKEFLKQEKSGNIEIFIDLKGKKISTKISIAGINNLKKWAEKKWN